MTLLRDEGNRPDTTREGLTTLQPVMEPDTSITAGNASQLSDGSSACILMEAKEAERRNLEPLGAFRGFVATGCEPDEMGIGPILAVRTLFQRFGLRMEDIDLWGAQRGLRQPDRVLPRPAPAFPTNCSTSTAGRSRWGTRTG